MKSKLACLTLLAIGLFLFWSESLAATADHPVISQVQITGGPGKTINDFVEIYNPTSQDVDLKGLRLVKRTKTGTVDTPLKSWTKTAIIKSHGFYLWANSDFTNISVAADATTTATIANDNGVALRNGSSDTGAIVDSLAWGAAANTFAEGAAFATNPEVGQSLERKPGSGTGNGEDTDSNAQDFFLQTTAHPRNTQSPPEPVLAVIPPSPPSSSTPTSTPSGSGATGGGPRFALEISEIMPNPKGRDAGAEWVEFYNADSGDWDLSGWYLGDSSAVGSFGGGIYQLPSGTVSEARKFLVVTIPKGKFVLNNTGGDGIWLFDNSQKPRLQQTYAESAKEGFAFARDSGGVWSWTDAPTPGAANSFAAPEVFPATLRISEVLPDPAGNDAAGEFIEIFNFGSDSVDVADCVVADNRKRYVIKEEDFSDTEIPAHSYLVLYREVTGLSLNNQGSEEVKLFNPRGELLDKIVFEAAAREGQSYARRTEGDYQWTASLTPGQANVFVTGSSETKSKPKEDKPASKVKAEEPQISFVPLAEIRNEPPGEVVSTSGIAVVELGVLGDQVSYLAGSGIRVFFDEPAGIALKAGDEIQVTGALATYHGERQLKVSDGRSIKLLNTNLPVRAHAVSTGEIGAATEGFLVQVAGQVITTSGDTFYLDDGSGQARVYIRESTGIQKPKMKVGDQAQIVGVVSQYDGNYRILPRYQNDVLVSQVAGAKTEKSLPRTGAFFWLILAEFFGFCAIYLAIFAIIKPKSLL